ncbi:dephospho-CoA kinase [bacterium]|nr:MAG: dephospho-CoA kinase [bacterium]
MKKNSKVILGLTGSFGTGKTTVAGIFKSLGADVIDADKIAHQIILPHGEVYGKIVAIFGKGILKKDESINRVKLGELVFHNDGLLSKLNSIMHPVIVRVMKEKAKASVKDIVVLDAPLLIETGLDKAVDKIVVVTASLRSQVLRLKKRAHLEREDILKRIKSQIPLSAKVRVADFIIDNNGKLEKTKKEIQNLRRSLWKS